MIGRLPKLLGTLVTWALILGLAALALGLIVRAAVFVWRGTLEGLFGA